MHVQFKNLLTVLIAGAISGGFCPARAQTVDVTAVSSETLPTGRVIERVVCAEAPAQSYALYLPSNYDAGRRWPILYAFEPSARGPLPTKLFHTAAERLGYIVVCSNNSRNGPWEPSLAALDAVWRDTHARFSLDPARIYTTGCSGGNGPALALASQRPIAGMIACAGALDAKQVAGLDRNCAWISVAGDADFNYDMNRSVVESLVGRGLVARFTTFAGPHRWPPEEIAAQALEYLRLAEMRRGVQTPDTAFIQHYIEQGQARASILIKSARSDLASEEYAALARELAGLAPTDAFTAEATRLSDTPETRKNRKREAALAAKYDHDLTEIATLCVRLESDGPHAPLVVRATPDFSKMGRGRNSSLGAQREMDAEDPDDASTSADEQSTVGSELSARIDQLLQEQKAKKDDVRIVATRVADWLYVDSFTVARKSRDEHKFAEALELFKVCAQLRPSTSGPAYEVAHAYAALGDKKRALAELKKAKSLGFTDTNRLSNEPEWQPLRAQPEFQRLADAIRAASDKVAKKPAGTTDQVVLGETRRPAGESAETPVSPPQTTTTVQVVVTKTPYTAMSLPTAPSRMLHETKMPNHEMDDQTYLLPQQKVSAIFGDIDIIVLRDEAGQGYIDGVIITHVKPGTRAEKLGLKSGMEITEIMGHPLRQKVSRTDFNRIMEEQFEGYFFRMKVRDRLVLPSKIEKDTPYLLLADLSPEQIERKYPAREITLQLR